jgi:hypothetical protein
MRIHKYADQSWADDLEAAIAKAVMHNDEAKRRAASARPI